APDAGWPAPAVTLDAAIAVATPAVHDGPLPARFAHALPAGAHDLESPERFPPIAYVRARLDAGDRAMRARMLDAVRRARTLRDDLFSYYFDVTDALPSICDWERDV